MKMEVLKSIPANNLKPGFYKIVSINYPMAIADYKVSLTTTELESVQIDLSILYHPISKGPKDCELKSKNIIHVLESGTRKVTRDFVERDVDYAIWEVLNKESRQTLINLNNITNLSHFSSTKMEIANTLTTPVEPQTGLYQFHDVVRFKDTTKFPVALVNYKRNVSFTAVKNLAFFLNIESLYDTQSTGPKNIRPEDLKGNIINVKSIDTDRKFIGGKLSISQIADWEIIDKWSLYDLYMQEEEVLVIPED
jgi:hypothetical protein